jgi:hypothetical protein
LTSIGLILHIVKLIESYKKMTLGGTKDEHFSCFHRSCQLGSKDSTSFRKTGGFFEILKMAFWHDFLRRYVLKNLVDPVMFFRDLSLP